MDDDLAERSWDELLAEVVRLRAGVRAHRDASGQDLCWHHPQLWGLLPEPIPRDGLAAVPARLRENREALDREVPDAPRTDEEYER